MHVILVRPEIPQNTGSIARTCAATRTPLHIVGDTPFEISDRTVRRAGLDYWPFVELHRHATWEGLVAALPTTRLWYFSKFAKRLYYEADFSDSDGIVFGSETKGLGEEFIRSVPPEQLLKIPMIEPGVRSLNLSNAVSIALYEARRQCKMDQEGV